MKDTAVWAIGIGVILLIVWGLFTSFRFVAIVPGIPMLVRGAMFALFIGLTLCIILVVWERIREQ
ncbi:hypothetical protein M1N17_02685 [Dehalococcoidia bacterium]|nr:hypothetical protein [Dehalococcoidia bacterium]